MTERTFSVQFRVGRALASFYVTAPDYEMAYEIGQSMAESQFPHCEIAVISAQELRLSDFPKLQEVAR